MAALAAVFETFEKASDVQNYPVGAAKKVFKGALTVADGTTGYAETGADAAAKNFIGVAYETGDNSAGAAAAVEMRVKKRGSFLFNFTGGAPTVAAIGKTALLADDNTVQTAATVNSVNVGTIVAVEGTKVRVRIDSAVK